MWAYAVVNKFLLCNCLSNAMHATMNCACKTQIILARLIEFYMYTKVQNKVAADSCGKPQLKEVGKNC